MDDHVFLVLGYIFFFFLVSLNEEVEGDGVSLIMGLLCKDGGS